MPSGAYVLSGKRLFLDICAGATRPLSQAALQAGMHVLSVDPLCAGQLDLFNDLHYEQLLRLSFSGAVWFACASPPCGDFSTIKLRPGPGPKPIRTREHPFGIPDASASQLVRLQKSLCLLERSVSILLAVFQAGGHTSLEQPPNALSWRQSMVQPYLLEVSASCCCIAACAFGMSVHKRWMFATSFAGLSALACVCSHERSAHVDVAGKRLADGTYLSRGTAEYPASLATEFMRTIQHLGDTTGPCDYALRDAVQLVPRKDLDALPVAFQDGGGMGSIPDWSCPPQGKANLLLSLRKKWLGMLFELGLWAPFLLPSLSFWGHLFSAVVCSPGILLRSGTASPDFCSPCAFLVRGRFLAGAGFGSLGYHSLALHRILCMLWHTLELEEVAVGAHGSLDWLGAKFSCWCFFGPAG